MAQICKDLGIAYNKMVWEPAAKDAPADAAAGDAASAADGAGAKTDAAAAPAAGRVEPTARPLVEEPGPADETGCGPPDG